MQGAVEGVTAMAAASLSKHSPRAPPPPHGSSDAGLVGASPRNLHGSHFVLPPPSAQQDWGSAQPDLTDGDGSGWGPEQPGLPSGDVSGWGAEQPGLRKSEVPGWGADQPGLRNGGALGWGAEQPGLHGLGRQIKQEHDDLQGIGGLSPPHAHASTRANHPCHQRGLSGGEEHGLHGPRGHQGLGRESEEGGLELGGLHGQHGLHGLHEDLHSNAMLGGLSPSGHSNLSPQHSDLLGEWVCCGTL